MSTTWNSASTSSSLSSQKYNLDEADDRAILVYQYRKGLAIESQSSLCKNLDKSLASKPLRVSRKRIPRGNSRIEVRQEDLYNESEKERYAKYPNSKNSLANIGLPRLVYWKRLLLNQFQDLYIVSPESSPENSPESSQQVTPIVALPPDDSFPALPDSSKDDDTSEDHK